MDGGFVFLRGKAKCQTDPWFQIHQCSIEVLFHFKQSPNASTIPAHGVWQLLVEMVRNRAVAVPCACSGCQLTDSCLRDAFSSDHRAAAPWRSAFYGSPRRFWGKNTWSTNLLRCISNYWLLVGWENSFTFILLTSSSSEAGWAHKEPALHRHL